MATKARFKKSDAGSGATGAPGIAPPGARCSSNYSSPRSIVANLSPSCFISSQSISAAKRTAASTTGGVGAANGAEKAKAKAVQVIFNGKIVTPLPLGGMLHKV